MDVKLSSLVIFILIGAMVFGLVVGMYFSWNQSAEAESSQAKAFKTQASLQMQNKFEKYSRSQVFEEAQMRYEERIRQLEGEIEALRRKK